MGKKIKPTFFRDPSQFRAWLEKHHEQAGELWVGYHKKGSGRPSMTWAESVDEALCFGWIDGIRKSVDATSYMNRFTPRRAGSTWSAVNLKRVEELAQQGRMRPAGLRALGARSAKRSGVYSYEQRKAVRLSDAFLRQFRSDKEAWTHFQAQPPSYRTMATWWVMDAKREETRARRLARLIEDSRHGRTVPPLTRPTRRLESKRGEQGD